jgi:hypothetical protein
MDRTHRPYPGLGERLGTGRDVGGVRGRAAVQKQLVHVRMKIARLTFGSSLDA